MAGTGAVVGIVSVFAVCALDARRVWAERREFVWIPGVRGFRWV